MRAALTLVVALGVSGCSDDTYDVLVDLRTDFAPGIEFDRVTVRLDSLDASGAVSRVALRSTETSARAGLDFIGGQRVAELRSLPVGTYSIDVELRDADGEVATRAVALSVNGNVGAVVVVTRSCGAVICPGPRDPVSATTCVAGRCVDPSCLRAGDGECPARECSADADCNAAVAACVAGACAEGFCLYGAAPGACGPAELCDPDVGCVHAVRDAGPSLDAGPSFDAGPLLDAGRDARPFVDGGPWLSGWSRRKPIDFSADRVPADLSEFPAYVGLDVDADLAAHAMADGADLRFTGADGTTPLPHEVERFDPETGRLGAWVRLPLLSSSADTRIYLYYGNAAAVPVADPAAVWDAGYLGVWHLAEPPGAGSTIVDSTGFIALTSAGGMTASDRVDGPLGWAIDFDGADDRLSAAATDRLAASGAVTVSAWVRVRTWQPNAGTIAARATMEGSNANDYYLRAGMNDLNFGIHTGSPEGITAGDWGTADEWHFVAGTFDGSTLRLYFDGAEVESRALSATIRNTMRPFHIGSWGVADPERTWNGQIDEVRVSAVARSADYLATRFANESAPATFHSVGSEEHVSPP